jgi:hypothetical protein
MTGQQLSAVTEFMTKHGAENVRVDDSLPESLHMLCTRIRWVFSSTKILGTN